MTGHTPIVLVLRHHGLGDLVTAQPALRALRRRFPAHEIVTSCPSWLRPLAEFLGGAHGLLTESSNDFAADPVNHQHVDAALLANILDTTPAVDVLVALRTPGPELTAFADRYAPAQVVCYRSSYLRSTSPPLELDFTDHILVRWQRLLAGIDAEVDDRDIEATLAPPPKSVGFTLIHAGAGAASRHWPIDSWATVAAWLARSGHRVILTGTAGEAEGVDAVRRRSGLPPDSDRCGTTTVMELTELVAGARLILSADTGISHLATAFRRPAVTLFGPVPPAWWGPPQGHSEHKVLWTGRQGDNYSGVPDPGLLEITLGDVIRAVGALEREGRL